ncbi:MAG: hypothetical protein DRN47_04435 [Candidatus Wolframiiraptor sp.]|nr:MAG: hypothetical protein DRN47_04435 [Candidatus Wolframiiraptor sp.]
MRIRLAALILLTTSLIIICEALSEAERHAQFLGGKLWILSAAFYLILYAVLIFLIISEVRNRVEEGFGGLYEGLSH